MVYAEKILGREIRWEDLPPRSGVGAHGGLLRTKNIYIDYVAQQTSLGARPRLEPSPPTSPTTQLVTSPNQRAGRELSRLPLSTLAVRERQINFAANLANVPSTNLTNLVAETSSCLVEEQLTNKRAIFESKLRDLEEKVARLETGWSLWYDAMRNWKNGRNGLNGDEGLKIGLVPTCMQPLKTR